MIKASGDVAVDEISVGIFVGDWKNEVLPHAQQLFNGLFEGGQLPFSRSSFKSRAVRVPDLNAAVLKCNTHNIKPVFLGPTTIDGLTTGDDVAEHLNPTENEDKCASCTSLTPSVTRSVEIQQYHCTGVETGSHCTNTNMLHSTCAAVGVAEHTGTGDHRPVYS